MFFGYFFFFTN